MKPQSSNEESRQTIDSAKTTLDRHAAYLRRIDRLRKAVAVAMLVCGVGFVLCTNLDNHHRITLRELPGLWTWGRGAFGIGVASCLIATIALVGEYLIRPYIAGPSGRQHFAVRSSLVLLAVSSICLWSGIVYGISQGVGVAIGAILVLASVREGGSARVALGSVSVVVLGLTVWSTQSAYQYARRHAEEIVTAGCELMDRVPAGKYDDVKIEPSDPRVPDLIRKLGAQAIWVHEDYVFVSLGGPGGAGFDIYRHPQPHAQGKAETAKITDRLWYL
jgi:hypothetical protein